MRGETRFEGRYHLLAVAAIAVGACGEIAPVPAPADAGAGADAAAFAADADVADVADAVAGYGSRCVSAQAQISCVDQITGGETFDWYGPDGASHGCADPGFPCPLGDTCKPFQETWTGTCQP
jgi:hypothetical protein